MRLLEGEKTDQDGTEHTGHAHCLPLKDEAEMRKISIIVVLLLAGCVGIPEKVKPVDDFTLEKYLGKWYEIARLDHSFERGLIRVTADYSLRNDGGVRVVNRGYSKKENITDSPSVHSIHCLEHR